MKSLNLIHPIHFINSHIYVSMNTSFQGRRYHDLNQVKAWLEPNLHKIFKWSLFCNLYQNISKIDNERKKSVGLLFLSHEKPHTCATWPVMVKFRKEKKRQKF